MPYLKAEHKQVAQAIEDWIETARHAVDDVGAWRNHRSERSYHTNWKPDDAFGPLTASLVGYVQQHTRLDPEPIQRVHAEVTKWYNFSSERPTSPQRCLEGDLERAMVVLVGIRNQIVGEVAKNKACQTRRVIEAAKFVQLTKGITKGSPSAPTISRWIKDGQLFKCPAGVDVDELIPMVVEFNSDKNGRGIDPQDLMDKVIHKLRDWTE